MATLAILVRTSSTGHAVYSIIHIIFVLALLLLGPVAASQTHAAPPSEASRLAAAGSAALTDAQAHFYNARYDLAAEVALALVLVDPANLPAYELRSSALLFQIKRALGDAADKDRALKQCAMCPGVMTDFQKNTVGGIAQARERLKADPKDDDALFFLGKLDLNHVWLHLGTLGRRTGWSEYWEARHSLDEVLQRNPSHARARIARAWIDYIVDTRVGWGRRWILGGGNRKGALVVMREAADADEDFFTSTEARFALWDVQVREQNFRDALVSARRLAVDFPSNAELIRFIDKHSPAIRP